VSLDEVEIRNYTTGERIQFWTEYQHDADFLTPTDGWSFTAAHKDYFAKVRDSLQPGTRITFSIGDRVFAAGLVDGITTRTSRAGLTFNVQGRDPLSPLVDSGIDPKFVFTAQQTLLDVVKALVPPYGITQFTNSDLANRSAVTGINPANAKKTTTTVGASAYIVSNATAGGVASGSAAQTFNVTQLTDPTRPDWFKQALVSQLKPHFGEHVFEFLGKLCKRLGLWLWCDARGETLIIDQPDFAQSPTYDLRRRTDGSGNVVSMDYQMSGRDQPTLVLASGFGVQSGPSFDKSKLKIAMVNELTGVDENGRLLPSVREVLMRYKGMKVLPVRPELAPYARHFRSLNVRPWFIQDEESKTQAQLEAFTRREMADRQVSSFSIHANVPGHTQNGAPWHPNTTVRIDDDVLDIHETWWVKARTFRKSRAGTSTELTLVPLHTVRFYG
jgi:prophage tail gpP-like protein